MVRDSRIFDLLLENISEELRRIMIQIPYSFKEKSEEIRLRNGKPLSISCEGVDYFITLDGRVKSSSSGAIIINEEHIQSTFQIISNYSVYAYMEEIRNGYITIKGGHRVGIGGKVVYGPNGIETIRNISSLNIRIGREKIGISEFITPYLLEDTGIFYSTLIISPPQCGKTTLLRDIIRNLSDGNISLNRKGFKISVVDERSEIAGVYNNIPQNEVGIRTDILDGCLKSDGIMMAIRSMSPDIIAVDEIGGKKDIEAINEALRAGIKLIATVHGSSLKEVMEKRSMDELFKENVFERFIILDRSKGVGTIKELIDGYNFKSIDLKKRD
ncbi:stage III sporulation protein AA [Tissierella sp.]|uniref:stage III sporulation protein AA n=1 Tax=Tissierella sp. TaxID=41274 RepID=UPI00286542F0|nr:stage III sporulation protein AA [Tissierella sp.]MDR7856138.1 stage III sporulation protein AA [Tissierella sp.]